MTLRTLKKGTSKHDTPRSRTKSISARIVGDLLDKKGKPNGTWAWRAGLSSKKEKDLRTKISWNRKITNAQWRRYQNGEAIRVPVTVSIIATYTQTMKSPKEFLKKGKR